MSNQLATSVHVLPPLDHHFPISTASSHLHHASIFYISSISFTSTMNCSSQATCQRNGSFSGRPRENSTSSTTNRSFAPFKRYLCSWSFSFRLSHSLPEPPVLCCPVGDVLHSVSLHTTTNPHHHHQRPPSTATDARWLTFSNPDCTAESLRPCGCPDQKPYRLSDPCDASLSDSHYIGRSFGQSPA